MNVPERDWKLLKQVHETGLQRFCERVLGEVRDVTEKSALSAHERFLELVELLHVRNRDMAQAFDDLRRSTAFHKVIAMRRLGVLTDAELQPFSDDTRTRLARFEGEFDLTASE